MLSLQQRVKVRVSQGHITERATCTANDVVPSKNKCVFMQIHCIFKAFIKVVRTLWSMETLDSNVTSTLCKHFIWSIYAKSRHLQDESTFEDTILDECLKKIKNITVPCSIIWSAEVTHATSIRSIFMCTGTEGSNFYNQHEKKQNCWQKS